MSGSAPRTPWLLGLARRYVRRRLARGLDGLRAGGVEEARRAAAAGPVILAANHVSWWDPFLVVALDEALGTEGYALMDAGNLAALPYFARLGALPLDRRSPARLRAGLRAAAELLDRPRRAVWMFPQGRLRPAHLRPLGVHPGIALLARLAPGAAVVPVAVQYAFGEHAAPAALARFGDAIPNAAAATHEGAARLERALEEELGKIDASLAGGAPPLPVLVASRLRRPDRGLGSRVLGRLRARREGGGRG
ncbi:MAG TPA: lysophospholipid acyltransferase family protein [Longimicrobiaceae bacterium]|nr:lysophospholipid acyltransferase family protein [Longimicrobiaceae bacterium]